MADLTVFISYRRADSSADAGRLYDALRRRFGRENLFMDVDSLRPGEDWVDAVEGAVTRCDVLLAVIGPDWAGGADADGVKRIHKELDRVRLEIEAALRHDKPVIPVLVEGASMPTSAELPESLKPLLRRHAIRVSHSTFESDLGALVRALRIIDRARPGRAAAMDREDGVKSTLVVTPAPEPALPGPPPTSPAGAKPTPTPTPSSATPFSPSPAVPPPPAPPGPMPGYVPPAAIPPTPPQPAYTPPSTTPGYTYTQPAYGYPQPAAQKSGPSSLVIGAIALGTVIVVGIVLMAVMGVGPFDNTAQVTATPVLTTPPTTGPTVVPTTTPSLIPPTNTPTTVAPTTAPPTISPPGTATASPPADDFARLRALVPDDVEQYCEDDTSFGNRLHCFVDPLSVSFWYELFPNEVALNEEYDGWLDFRNLERDTANCFDTPIPLPCEGEYQVGNIDPAGRVAGLLDGENGWMYWTHVPSGMFGEGLTSIDEDDTFEELFAYWADSASVLDYTPPATP